MILIVIMILVTDQSCNRTFFMHNGEFGQKKFTQEKHVNFQENGKLMKNSQKLQKWKDKNCVACSILCDHLLHGCTFLHPCY